MLFRSEAIPLDARIFSVADALDAMTFDRPYSRAIPLEDARSEIRRCAGTQFDPAVVDTFLGIPLEIFDAIRRGDSDGEALEEIEAQGVTLAALSGR